MNIILKSIIVLILLFLPAVCNADNFDKLLKKESTYHKLRQTVSGMMISMGYDKGKYTKRITESKNKLDTLNKIDSKNKSKILEQITKNVAERTTVVNNEIKKYENKIKSTKENMKKFPTLTPTYLTIIKGYSTSIKSRQITLKSLNENQKDLNTAQKNIRANKLKEKAPIIVKTTKKSTLDKFKKFLQTKKKPPSTTPKTSSSSNIDRFKRFLNTKRTTIPNLKPRTVEDGKSMLKNLLDKSKKSTPKVIPEPIRIKKRWSTVQPISMPPPKKPTNAIMPPKKITPPKPKPQLAKKSDGKTVLKNVNILTSSKIGNIDTKGNLSIANVKVAKGSTLKDTNINADVNVKNVSVSKGSSTDIGSVKIEN